MNSPDNRTKIIAGAALAVLAISSIAIWQSSKSNARRSAAALVTASADMVRCAGGDKVQFTREGVQYGYFRRLITSLPDSNPVSDCPLPLETTKKALEEYEKVWFKSTSSIGKDGKELGLKIQTSINAMATLKYDYPSNKLFRKKDADHPLREFAKLSWDLYEASAELMERDGARTEEVEQARETRKREARKVAPLAPQPKELFSITGKVDPDRWALVPADEKQLMFFAHSDKGEVLVGRSVDAGASWGKTTGSDKLSGKADASVSMILSAAKEPWLVSSWNDGSAPHLAVSKVARGIPTLAASVELPAVPRGWTRAPGAEREVVVLEGDVLAYAVMKIGPKSAKQKQEEEKNRKDWEKRSIEKEVQALLILDKARNDAHLALNIDADHLRIDGLAYVVNGKSDDAVRELAGWGLSGLVAGPTPLMLLGKDEVPALDYGVVPIALPGQVLSAPGMASAPRVVKPWLRGPSWLRCSSADGNQYAVGEGGTVLLGMRAGALELTPMTAEASTESHMGCGENAALLTLPMQVDSIFPRVLTVRGGEIEGGKISSTSGTIPQQYTSTVAVGITNGAVVAAWVASGYVQSAVSRNGGSEFGAPVQVGEAGVEGTKLSGVRMVTLGAKLMLVMARERCDASGTCSTSFESLTTDDAAKTWK